MKAQVHIRQQHAKRGNSGFAGPDTYVAVTITPDTAVLPLYLNQDVLTKRGIEIHYFGEGYRQYSGPRSALGKALDAAKKFAAEQNEKFSAALLTK